MGKAKKSANKKAAAKPAKKVAAKATAKKTAKPAAKKSVAKPTAKKLTAKPATQKASSSKAPAKTPAPKIQAAKAIKTDWPNFVTPLDDRLIVQLESAERKTAGGLYIPDTSFVRGQFRGNVLVVGRGHRTPKGNLRPMDVKAGDIVVFEEQAGSKMDINGNEVRILRESEILAIVEK